MSNKDITAENILSALNTLFSTPHAAQAANDYLTAAVESPQSWDVLVHVLSQCASEDAAAAAPRFFIANALARKAKGSARSLTKDARVHYKDLLLNAAATHIQDFRVLHKLSAAVSHFCFALWQHTPVSAVLQSSVFSSFHMSAKLEFLSVLAEELPEAGLARQSDLAVKADLSAAAPAVVSLVQQALGHLADPTASPAAGRDAMRAFSVLQHWGPLGIPMSVLLSSGLLQATIQGLSLPAPVCTSVADCAAAALSLPASDQEMSSAAAFAEMLARCGQGILGTRADDEDCVHGLAKVISQLATSFDNVVATCPQANELHQIALALLANEHFATREMALDYFEAMNCSSQATSMQPLFLQVLSTIVHKCVALPSDFSCWSDSEIDEESFSQHRRRLQDGMVDCAVSLGIETLSYIVNWLSEACNSQSWQAVEAVLFCYVCVAREMLFPEEAQKREAARAQSAAFCSQWILSAGRLPQNQMVTAASLRVLRASSVVLAASVDSMLPAVQMCITACAEQHATLDTISAGAAAFQEIVTTGRGLLVPHAETLVEHVAGVFPAIAAKLKDSSEPLIRISEAMSRLIAETQPAQASPLLQKCAAPAFLHLQSAANQLGNGGFVQASALASIVAYVNCLAGIMRFLPSSWSARGVHPAVEVLGSMWNTLQTLASAGGNDVLDAVCGLIRFIVGAARQGIQPALPHLASLLPTALKSTHSPAVMNTVAACIEACSSCKPEEESYSQLQGLLSQCLQASLEALQQQGGWSLTAPPGPGCVALPDLAHATIDTAMRAVIFVRAQLVSTGQLPHVLELSAAMVASHDPTGCRLGATIIHQLASNAGPGDDVIQAAVPVLITACLHGAAHAAPEGVLRRIGDTMHRLLKRAGGDAQTMLSSSAASLPLHQQTTPSPMQEATEKLLVCIGKIASEPNRFGALITDYGKICRRKADMDVMAAYL